MKFSKNASRLNEDKYQDTLDTIKKMISGFDSSSAPSDVGFSIYGVVFESLRMLNQFVYKHPEFKEDYTQELFQKIHKLKAKFK